MALFPFAQSFLYVPFFSFLIIFLHYIPLYKRYIYPLPIEFSSFALVILCLSFYILAIFFRKRFNTDSDSSKACI